MFLRTQMLPEYHQGLTCQPQSSRVLWQQRGVHRAFRERSHLLYHSQCQLLQQLHPERHHILSIERSGASPIHSE